MKPVVIFLLDFPKTPAADEMDTCETCLGAHKNRCKERKAKRLTLGLPIKNWLRGDQI